MIKVFVLTINGRNSTLTSPNTNQAELESLLNAGWKITHSTAMGGGCEQFAATVFILEKNE